MCVGSSAIAYVCVIEKKKKKKKYYDESNGKVRVRICSDLHANEVA